MFEMTFKLCAGFKIAPLARWNCARTKHTQFRRAEHAQAPPKRAAFEPPAKLVLSQPLGSLSFLFLLLVLFACLSVTESICTADNLLHRKKISFLLDLMLRPSTRVVSRKPGRASEQARKQANDAAGPGTMNERTNGSSKCIRSKPSKCVVVCIVFLSVLSGPSFSSRPYMASPFSCAGTSAVVCCDVIESRRHVSRFGLSELCFSLNNDNAFLLGEILRVATAPRGVASPRCPFWDSS